MHIYDYGWGYMDKVRHMPSINNDKGFVLATALVILLALTVIGTIMLNTSALESRIAGVDREAAQAILLAEAGGAQIREWFQYPETFTPIGNGFSGNITVQPFRDCTGLDPAVVLSSTSCPLRTGLDSVNEKNFFRRRFADLGKREYIINATQMSQFTDPDADGTQNVFNPVDQPSKPDTPALKIENQAYLNWIFRDYAAIGNVVSIKIYPPIANPLSGKVIARPRPICTARITVRTKGGIEKTVEMEVMESIFLTIDAGAEAGAAASWNGSGQIYWGKILAKGNTALNYNQLRNSQRACNGGTPLTWPDGDPWFRAYIEGTVSASQGSPTPNNCTDCIGCEGIANSPANGGKRVWNELHVYQGMPVTLDEWKKPDMQDYAESLGTYYKINTLNNTVYKSNRNGDVLGPAVAFNADWLKNNKSPFIYLDAGGNIVNINFTGQFFREGDIYLDGSFDIGGGGSGSTISVVDPSNTAQSLSDINIKGVLYMTGELRGTGSPRVFGGIVAEGGLQSQGNPVVYYDKELMEGRRNLPRTAKGMWREIM